MNDALNGPQIFLRFAWPCANSGLASGEITVQDFDTLSLLVEKTDPPNTELLKRCFPKAVQSLGDFAKEKSRANQWSPDTVLEYWRGHKGRDTDCAVVEAVIRSIEDGLMSRVQYDDKKYAFNPYRLDLKVGDTILLHRSVVVTTTNNGSA
jgi:hypothetical protein